MRYPRRLTNVGMIATLLALLVASAHSDTPERAHELFLEGDWPGAASAYAEVVKTHGDRGEVWQSYGFALHQLERYDESIPAFTRALELGSQPAVSMFNIACGLALQGDVDDALTWLGRAMDAGMTEEAAQDTDLDALRDDPRFAAIMGIPPEGLSPNAQWRFDIAFFARRMRQIHFDIDRIVRIDDFLRACERLSSHVEAYQRHEIVVELQRIAAMVGDGHTRVRFPSGGEHAFHHLPVDLYLFSDGLHVRRAAPDHAELVGGRVISIGNATADDAMNRLRPVISVDNEMGYRAAVRGLACPEILHAIGIVDDLDQVPMVVETLEGERREVTLAAQPRQLRTGPDARDEADAPDPLYLQRTDQPFWYVLLDEPRFAYLQFNAVRDAPGRSLAQLAEDLIEFIEVNQAEGLIVDMRLNGGGNLLLTQPLIHALIRCDRVNQPGRLFMITGRRTFSAAMYTAAQIDRHTEALFVGEPTGSRPNFVGETTIFTLPCSGTEVSCSNLFWQGTVAFDTRTWIAPDLPAELSLDDYLHNRDPALEAIRTRVRALSVGR